MSSSRRVAALVLRAVALAAALPAAAAGWTPVGPSGGAIRALAQDPAGGALYAGTAARVYRIEGLI